MIYIEPIRVKWEPGSLLLPRVRDSLTKKELLDFEDYVAKEYVRIVRSRVATQKFASKWKPLSKRYLQWKREQGLSLKTWEATGQLMKELYYKSNRVIGFDNRKRHKLSGEELLVVARTVEYGDLTVPPRPLFRPVYIYMRKHIQDFYNKYMEVNR